MTENEIVAWAVRFMATHRETYTLDKATDQYVLSMVPHQHVPFETRLQAIIVEAQKAFRDTERKP